MICKEPFRFPQELEFSLLIPLIAQGPAFLVSIIPSIFTGLSNVVSVCFAPSMVGACLKLQVGPVSSESSSISLLIQQAYSLPPLLYACRIGPYIKCIPCFPVLFCVSLCKWQICTMADQKLRVLVCRTGYMCCLSATSCSA